MKQPIIEPDFFTGEHRFRLGREGLSRWKSKLQLLSIIVKSKSRQYLEDCEADVTELIAEDGVFIYMGEKFPFVAQLDVQGFCLYIDGLNSNSQVPRDFHLQLRVIFEQQ
jgi:hypothetical protein